MFLIWSYIFKKSSWTKEIKLVFYNQVSCQCNHRRYLHFPSAQFLMKIMWKVGTWFCIILCVIFVKLFVPNQFSSIFRKRSKPNLVHWMQNRVNSVHCVVQVIVIITCSANTSITRYTTIHDHNTFFSFRKEDVWTRYTYNLFRHWSSFGHFTNYQRNPMHPR